MNQPIRYFGSVIFSWWRQHMKPILTIAILFFLSANSASALHRQSTPNNEINLTPLNDYHPLEKPAILGGDNTKTSLYQSRVMDLITYSLGFYLEELVLWNNPTVTFRHPRAKQFGHLNDIVIQALTLYDHPAKDSFWGFSGRLESDLLDFQKFEGYIIDYTEATSKENHISAAKLKFAIEQMKVTSVAEVEDFIGANPDPIDSGGRLLNVASDVPFSDDDDFIHGADTQEELALLIDSLFELEEIPFGLIGQVKTRIETLKNPSDSDKFRKYQQLDPVVHLIQKVTMADESELVVAVPSRMPKKSKKQRKSGSGDFNERVIELLEENNHLMAKYNNRFDQIHGDINQLKATTTESDRDLQSQIDEIREMVSRSTVRDEANRRHAPTTVIFERNSTQLSLVQQTQLNQVLAELIKNPAEKVMVTGYADALGNREYNILLSKKRALSVSHYLTEKGIDAHRLQVNFVGAEDSQSTNPLDRKVVIEWLGE